jgi:hypothetical protein
VVPRSLRSLAFGVAVTGAALAAGFAAHSTTPVATSPPPSKVVYKIDYVSTDVVDLRHVAWKRVSLPGRVCGVRGPVRLRDGKAFVNPHLEVDAGWHRVVYGDLDGDRRDEAAVSVACSNGGGTADSVWSYAVVVFRAGTRSPESIGILRPRHQARHMLPTLLEVSLRRGRVVGREAFYGSDDGTCCPSGRARTAWTYRDGTFHLGSTRVTKTPR